MEVWRWNIETCWAEMEGVVSYTPKTKERLSCCSCWPAQSSIEFSGMSVLVPLGLGTGSARCPGAVGGDNPRAVTFTSHGVGRCSANLCTEPGHILASNELWTVKWSCSRWTKLGLNPNTGFVFFAYLSPGASLQLWFLQLTSTTRIIPSGSKGMKTDSKMKYE